MKTEEHAIDLVTALFPPPQRRFQHAIVYNDWQISSQHMSLSDKYWPAFSYSIQFCIMKFCAFSIVIYKVKYHWRLKLGAKLYYKHSTRLSTWCLKKTIINTMCNMAPHAAVVGCNTKQFLAGLIVKKCHNAKGSHQLLCVYLKIFLYFYTLFLKDINSYI